jgi:hypothetical protein
MRACDIGVDSRTPVTGCALTEKRAGAAPHNNHANDQQHQWYRWATVEAREDNDVAAKCEALDILDSRFLMRGIYHRIRNHQALHRLPANNVRRDDFVHIFWANVPIPNCLWIDHHRRPQFTLVQTSTFVGAHGGVGNSALRQFGLEQPLQFALSRGVARTSRMPSFPSVHTHKNMFLKFRHG